MSDENKSKHGDDYKAFMAALPTGIIVFLGLWLIDSNVSYLRDAAKQFVRLHKIVVKHEKDRDYIYIEQK